MPQETANKRNEEEFAGRTTVLNETVNTEAFSSPKSELITSSPHGDSVHANERDAEIISVNLTKDYSLRAFLSKRLDFNGEKFGFQHLNRARQSIDRALLSMNMNTTRNIAHKSIMPALNINEDILLGENYTNRFNGTQENRTISGRATSALINGKSTSCIYT